jgi:hypothetical protein
MSFDDTYCSPLDFAFRKNPGFASKFLDCCITKVTIESILGIKNKTKIKDELMKYILQNSFLTGTIEKLKSLDGKYAEIYSSRDQKEKVGKFGYKVTVKNGSVYLNGTKLHVEVVDSAQKLTLYSVKEELSGPVKYEDVKSAGGRKSVKVKMKKRIKKKPKKKRKTVKRKLKGKLKRSRKKTSTKKNKGKKFAKKKSEIISELLF